MLMDTFVMCRNFIRWWYIFEGILVFDSECQKDMYGTITKWLHLWLIKCKCLLALSYNHGTFADDRVLIAKFALSLLKKKLSKQKSLPFAFRFPRNSKVNNSNDQHIQTIKNIK